MDRVLVSCVLATGVEVVCLGAFVPRENHGHQRKGVEHIAEICLLTGSRQLYVDLHPLPGRSFTLWVLDSLYPGISGVY